GHTHRAYQCRLASRDPAKKLLVTSAGNAGRFVGSLDLALDPATGDIIASSADILPVVNDRPGNGAPTLYPPLAAEPGIAALVEVFRARAQPLAARPVGRIAAEMLRTVDSAGEQPLGRVIADAQIAYAAKSADTRADIAFMNPDGVRADLKPMDAAGTVSFGQVYSVQPFGSELVTMSLTGAQIDALLEQQWRAKGRSPVLLPSKGFRYRWNADRPVGARVDAASISLNGVTIDPAQSYRVNVNGFLANGGDGFTVLTEGTERQAFGLDREALIDYLARFGPVVLPTDTRIERR
ncbi:bifunctional metallophosphatase/5'-nucleotidase, partial [Nevskia sp.]|uniref:bifunctional metallophosphatase/5'-nucleotidase n=1 Tax=Nevskia sp. TaxID=1929292 RepID=UPI0025FF886C